MLLYYCMFVWAVLMTYFYTNLYLRLMRHFILLALLIALISCKEKKANLSGDAPVKVNDFVAAFRPLTLPYTASDTNISKLGDTLNFSQKVFTQFVPDSVLTSLINPSKKFTIYPLGRIEKKEENYLLSVITQNKKTQLLVAVFDRKNKFLAAKLLLANNDNDGYVHTLSINREPTFTVSKERINNETKQLQFTRVGWVYASGVAFMVVINDTNEDPTKTGVLNPIDTLPKKNKLSGDYIRDKKNFISLRDGKNANNYLLFIHFEKREGTCIGELKGELKMKDDKSGIYSQAGDPCIIDFTFEGNDITLKEKGSCGNRRGIECFFDDTFTKKKEPKVKKKKTKEQ